ncbi:MAG: anthranilate synthase component I family protein [Acidobacteriia bacterium]|nr:anthranilate synthase component I family protein [Terriglobia bacterium]
MWSDRLTPSSRQALVERLRAVLPPPPSDARSHNIRLPWTHEVTDVAAALWRQRDFLWLDQPAETRLLVDPVARVTVRNGYATIRGPRGTARLKTHGLDLIEAALAAWGGPSSALLCGYLGYELGNELEEVRQPPRRSGDLPDLHLALYDWRMEKGPDGWRLCGTGAWRTRRAEDLEKLLQKESATKAPAFTAGPITSCPTDQGFQAAVARTVERIYNGELFQVNLCRRLETALPFAHIWPLYLRLRSISPASHGALVRTGARSAVLSVSPELFLSVRGGLARSCPIKGTRPRGGSPEQDRELAAALASSEKDRAELAMIVDVTRNDLGRVCAPGSVTVARHAELVSLPTVHHTYSEVTGQLRPECGPAELLRACFPPASITGAPKIRAMQLAAQEEGYRRGPAMGAIGWISLGGDMELSVAIRTAMASQDRVWYLAGCGITAESVPEEELAESQAKAVAFVGALGAAPIRPADRPNP